MPDYRRTWHSGGAYFLTVNLLQRTGNDLLVRHIDTLRTIVKSVQTRHPYSIHGWVVLPEHVHCVIELPEGDADFRTRCRLIKIEFSKSLPITERRSRVRRSRGEWGGLASTLLGTPGSRRCRLSHSHGLCAVSIR